MRRHFTSGCEPCVDISYPEFRAPTFYKRKMNLLCNQGKKEIYFQSTCSVFPSYICFLISFLTSQTSSEEVSSENEWLDF